MNSSIRLHLISGAGQHGSALVVRNDYESLTRAVNWAIEQATASHPLALTLVVIHGEANVIWSSEVPVPIPPTYSRDLREELVNELSAAWDEAEGR